MLISGMKKVAVLPTGIYIPNFTNLVYFESAWYVNFLFGKCEKFGISLQECLVEILNQFLVYYKVETGKPTVVLKLYESYVILLTWE